MDRHRDEALVGMIRPRQALQRIEGQRRLVTEKGAKGHHLGRLADEPRILVLLRVGAKVVHPFAEPGARSLVDLLRGHRHGYGRATP